MMKSFRLTLAALLALAFALGGLSGAATAKSTLLMAATASAMDRAASAAGPFYALRG